MWTDQSSHGEGWVRFDNRETVWDGGDTLWDVALVAFPRTVWDAGVIGSGWSQQASAQETWTRQ